MSNTFGTDYHVGRDTSGADDRLSDRGGSAMRALAPHTFRQLPHSLICPGLVVGRRSDGILSYLRFTNMAREKITNFAVYKKNKTHKTDTKNTQKEQNLNVNLVKIQSEGRVYKRDKVYLN